MSPHFQEKEGFPLETFVQWNFKISRICPALELLKLGNYAPCDLIFESNDYYRIDSEAYKVRNKGTYRNKINGNK